MTNKTVDIEADEKVTAQIAEFVQNITAKQWLLARRHFDEPAEVIAEETIAMTVFIAYLTDPTKGWDFYEEMTMSALSDVIGEHFKA